ncbi:hypothetical protein FDP41_000818 [Naegleria fowleri]|uniref:Uncharacterized protein n=1 Tax=Naegleria fowleri TaxID=5763 RepID=A0A6A5CHZ5_NAEFO|nr:uncharacterized protein FDP41_000818 [Naegleria fowleri]KAF0984919.1 hypothetical protein FDP41_000818 [Naegleria fowleri]
MSNQNYSHPSSTTSSSSSSRGGTTGGRGGGRGGRGGRGGYNKSNRGRGGYNSFRGSSSHHGNGNGRGGYSSSSYHHQQQPMNNFPNSHPHSEMMMMNYPSSNYNNSIDIHPHEEGNVDHPQYDIQGTHVFEEPLQTDFSSSMAWPSYTSLNQMSSQQESFLPQQQQQPPFQTQHGGMPQQPPPFMPFSQNPIYDGGDPSSKPVIHHPYMSNDPNVVMNNNSQNNPPYYSHPSSSSQNNNTNNYHNSNYYYNSDSYAQRPPPRPHYRPPPPSSNTSMKGLSVGYQQQTYYSKGIRLPAAQRDLLSDCSTYSNASSFVSQDQQSVDSSSSFSRQEQTQAVRIIGIPNQMSLPHFLSLLKSNVPILEGNIKNEHMIKAISNPKFPDTYYIFLNILNGRGGFEAIRNHLDDSRSSAIYGSNISASLKFN